MSVEEFPKDGERFCRELSPPLLKWLLLQTDAETADAVLTGIAPMARQAGDEKLSIPAGADWFKCVNFWVISIINHFLLGLAVRELELIALRAERDDLRAQLRRPRAV